MAETHSHTGARGDLSAARQALLEQRLRGNGVTNRETAIPRRPGDEPAVLSPGQERLWFVHALDPHGTSYSLYHVLRLHGPLDAAALEGALQEVVRRHEVLRTAFPAEAGRPRPVIQDEPAVPLRRMDLSAEPAPVRVQRARELASVDIARPFDLATAPLFRALLIRLDEDDHVLALTLHHIVADEWSLEILRDELAAAYVALHERRAVELPAVPLQYTDFAAWQRARLSSPVVARQLDWWTEWLRDLPELDLPADRARPARQSFRGGIVALPLSADLSGRIAALSRVERVTPFVLLLAAFNVLLARHAEQTEVVVGTPATGRTRAEIQRTVGFFVDTLVLRTDLGGDPAFREVLRRTADVVRDALAHQEAPFGAVVDAVGTRRRLDRNPLFQVMFVMRQKPRPHAFAPGLEARPFDVDASAARFDLTLFATDPAEGGELMLEYAADLFDRATAERLLGHMEVLLGAIVRDPAQRISTLPVLAEEERRRILEDFAVGPAAPVQEQCIHEWFAATAAARANAAALRADGRTVTYGELNARANALAVRLRSAGAGPGGFVGVYADRSPEMPIAILGVLKAGAAYVPLDPSWPPDRLRLILDDTDTAIVVAQRSIAGDVPACVEHVISVDGSAPYDDLAPAPETAVTGEDAAYVIHTSGSTGRPKGVPVTHGALVASTAARTLHYAAAPERFLLLSSFAFDSSVAGIFWTLCTGGTLVLPRTRIEQDLAELEQRIEGERITHTLCLPTLYALVLEHASAEQLRSLRAVIVAGEPCSAAAARAHYAALPGTELHNEYGPTEATVWSTVYAVPPECAESRIPIGRPVAGARVYVLDAAGQPVPIGVPGELYVGGVAVAAGYLKRPEETAARFLADPFAPGGRMYRTGDRARWRPDGTLEFLGRADRQIKVRGHRIEPAEIEAVLREHAAVTDAVVVQRAPQADRTGDDVDALVAALSALDPADADRLLEAVEREAGHEP